MPVMGPRTQDTTDSGHCFYYDSHGAGGGTGLSKGAPLSRTSPSGAASVYLGSKPSKPDAPTTPRSHGR